MRFHRGSDGWGRDSYAIPEYAVLGCSDTGTAPDSPAHSQTAYEETENFRRLMLRPEGIRSRIVSTESGNIFMQKRWVVVWGKDFERAKRLAEQYLEKYHTRTLLIHDAA